MKSILFIPMLHLQLFAEGGDAAGTGGDGGTAQGSGVTAPAAGVQKADKNPLSSVVYGKQPEDTAPVAEVQQEEPTEAKPDRNAQFEQLIKGEYKDLYDARMQDTIQRRFKSTNETVAKYNALTPTLELLGKKYGVDASDIDALNKAIQNDDSYFEEEALEKNISVPQLREIKKMERENTELRQKMQAQQTREAARMQMEGWISQAEETRKVYPSFDLKAEMQNPEFQNLLRSNVNMRTAYEVLHKDDIISGAMQFTAKKTQENLAKSIAASGSRPVENGMRSQSSATVKSDVSQLTKADRQEIARRVARGERISF